VVLFDVIPEVKTSSVERGARRLRATARDKDRTGDGGTTDDEPRGDPSPDVDHRHGAATHSPLG